MDYLEYTKKGFPLLGCSFLLFMYSGVWLLGAILSWHAFYLLPMSMALIPSALLYVMSWPRVYRREPCFRRLEVIHNGLGGCYWMILIGKFAFLAGAHWKRGDPIGVAILAGLLLGIPSLFALKILLNAKPLEAKEAPMSAMSFQFDKSTARVCATAVAMLMLIQGIAIDHFPSR